MHAAIFAHLHTAGRLLGGLAGPWRIGRRAAGARLAELVLIEVAGVSGGLVGKGSWAMVVLQEELPA